MQLEDILQYYKLHRNWRQKPITLIIPMTTKMHPTASQNWISSSPFESTTRSSEEDGTLDPWSPYQDPALVAHARKGVRVPGPVGSINPLPTFGRAIYECHRVYEARRKSMRNFRAPPTFALISAVGIELDCNTLGTSTPRCVYPFFSPPFPRGHRMANSKVESAENGRGMVRSLCLRGDSCQARAHLPLKI